MSLGVVRVPLAPAEACAQREADDEAAAVLVRGRQLGHRRDAVPDGERAATRRACGGAAPKTHRARPSTASARCCRARRAASIVVRFAPSGRTAGHAMPSLVDPPLAESDPEIARLIAEENRLEHDKIRLIASENYASRAVMEATGSVLTNKYSEGYAHKRYYEGQQVVDQVEELAIARLKAPLRRASTSTCSPTRAAPRTSPCTSRSASRATPSWASPSRPAGTSRTATACRSRASTSRACSTACSKDDHRIDLDQVRDLARASTGRSSSGAGRRPTRARSTSRRSAPSPTRSGAILVADIAHISGLVCGGVHPSPVGIADVVTSTTHKTFRGPRGGMIFCKKEHAAAIDAAVFPGLQGGPHNHVTAAIAVAANEAARPEFKTYAKRIVENAQTLGAALAERGFGVVTGGTDNHLLLVDVTSKGVDGQAARAGARPRGHRPQLQRRPLRSAQAVRPVRRPHRHARGDDARHGQGRDAAASPSGSTA